jgi:lipopolysaccharide/colanic/teichoic acid biosynthesis glycosyltransferase
MVKGKKINFAVVSLISVLSLFVFIGFCFAGEKAIVQAPEPGSMAMIATGVFGSLIAFVRRNFLAAKRYFDIVASSLGIIVLSPLILLTAIYIKIVSPGPAIFTQDRAGLNGKVFTIYKLRTMKLNAEKETGAVWAKENDPRLIKYGKFIRKAHLDELPQLFNVLKGDMSIIGPRPERPEIIKDLKKVICDYDKRLLIKPGITGLAQIRHRYDRTLIDVKKKVKLDLLYIRKMCFFGEISILARTLIVVVKGKAIS